MLPKEKMKRISELTKKSKTDVLTDSELKEQKALREDYLKTFRKAMRSQIEGMKIVDEKGTDLTPDKLKKIQKEKGLHNRSTGKK